MCSVCSCVAGSRVHVAWFLLHHQDNRSAEQPPLLRRDRPPHYLAIQLTQGQAREITRYSLVPCEGEVLLPPGCRFVVRSVLPQGDLTIIQIEELPSDEWILDLRADLPEGVPPQAGGGAAAAKQPEPQP